MGLLDWLMLFILIAPCTVIAVVLNRNFREGRCIGCGKCGSDPHHGCIFHPSATDKENTPP